MAGSIRSIKFIGGYEKFDVWKEKTREISEHKDILKHKTKEWDISSQ